MTKNEKPGKQLYNNKRWHFQQETDISMNYHETFEYSIPRPKFRQYDVYFHSTKKMMRTHLILYIYTCTFQKNMTSEIAANTIFAFQNVQTSSYDKFPKFLDVLMFGQKGSPKIHLSENLNIRIFSGPKI